MNPLNGLLRFLLELVAMISIGYWGMGKSGLLLAAGLIVLFVLIWGLFNVPGDPSRSGSAPIPVPGILRLLIELVLFSSAVWSLADMGYDNYGLIMFGLVIFHYAWYWKRVLWLLRIMN